MGRTEKSQGLAPPAIRKDMRAKRARHFVNKVVPAVLASNARARKGAEGSELFVDPGPVGEDLLGQGGEAKEEGEDVAGYVKRKGQGRRKVKDEGSGSGKRGVRKKDRELVEEFADLEIDKRSTMDAPTSRPTRRTRIIITDSLSAAHLLTFPSRYPVESEPRRQPNTEKKKDHKNLCILNMASPLRPGGGLLTGATSQEEFLCARTTLLPSLKESFYRLPEIGGAFTRDVLVLRDSGPLGEGKGELGVKERWWVDVVSAGMLRFPELEGAEEDPLEEKTWTKKDREMVEKKMRAVLRIVAGMGCRRVILGAWGCGAYGNPVNEVARAWRKVLDGAITEGGGGGKKRRAESEEEAWGQLEVVVFAIANRKMAGEFAEAFGGGVKVEDMPGGDKDGQESEEDEDQAAVQELRSKIEEMEKQIAQVWNPDLRARMETILQELRSQRAERE
ncbi:hypothetical protein M011DRAFT_374808, partial [Sporormia fimetaria CBS 119925]